MKNYILTTALLFLAGSAIALPTSNGQEGTCKPPGGGGKHTCTDLSSKTKEWTVVDFDYHAGYLFSTPSHQNSWGYVNFTLEHKAIAYKATCSAASNQLQDFFYGTVVYNCTLPTNAPAGDQAAFTFSRPSNELKLNQTWACADENSRFWAEGGVKLDLKCSDVFWQNPDWHQGTGEFYSTRTITCDKVTVPAPITSIRAVA